MKQILTMKMLINELDVQLFVKCARTSTQLTLRMTERRPLSQSTKKKGFNYIEHTLSLRDAMQIGECVLEIAKSMNAMPLSVSILDKSGQLKYCLNEDGTGLLRNNVSFGKAWTSLAMGFPSRNLAQNLKERPSFLGSLSDASNGKLICAPGGILILDKKSKAVIGALGISGDTSYRDEYLAITAAQKCGFDTAPSKPHPNHTKSHL